MVHPLFFKGYRKNMKDHQKHFFSKSSYLPWLMWGLAATFFAYQFIMRLFPGLVIDQVTQKFQIDATSFGIFSSAYYYGYASLQIPIAFLLDKYGSRVVISICALICAVSTYIFAYSEFWELILVSRFFIGAASAAGFLGTSKVISLWFDRSSYGRIVGFSFSYGLLGALYSGGPLNYFIDKLGWQQTAFLVFSIGVGLALLMSIFLRSPHGKRETKITDSENTSSLTVGIKSVLKNRRLLILGLANLLMVGTLEGFADIWGVTYLMKAYSIPKTEAAFATSLIFAGMIVGSPLLAVLSEKLKAYYEMTALCGILLGVIFTTLFIFHESFSYTTLCFLLFLAGIFCCYQVLVFAIGNQLVSIGLVGVTIAFLNCINMLGGSFFHTVIGSLLDCFWDGAMDGTIRAYCHATYTKALWIIPLSAFFGGCLALFLKPSLSKK